MVSHNLFLTKPYKERRRHLWRNVRMKATRNVNVKERGKRKTKARSQKIILIDLLVGPNLLGHKKCFVLGQ